MDLAIFKSSVDQQNLGLSQIIVKPTALEVLTHKVRLREDRNTVGKSKQSPKVLACQDFPGGKTRNPISVQLMGKPAKGLRKLNFSYFHCEWYSLFVF